VDPVTGNPVGEGEFHADHIVPLRYIVTLPGFDKLNDDQQEQIVHARDNIMGLSGPTNEAKGGRSWCDVKSVKGAAVPQAIRDQMIQREYEARVKLQQMIDDFLKAGGNGAGGQGGQGQAPTPPPDQQK
jgi:hypothetical protein